MGEMSRGAGAARSALVQSRAARDERRARDDLQKGKKRGDAATAKGPAFAEVVDKLQLPGHLGSHRRVC